MGPVLEEFVVLSDLAVNNKTDALIPSTQKPSGNVSLVYTQYTGIPWKNLLHYIPRVRD